MDDAVHPDVCPRRSENAPLHRHIHRSSEGSGLRQSAPPLWWSDELERWMTSDPATLQAILKSPDFHVIGYSDEALKIVEATGIDLTWTVRATRGLPLAQEGALHADLRRKAALHVNRHSAAALADIDIYLRREVPRVLAGPGQLDIVAELFAPLVGRLTKALTGASFDHAPGGLSPSQVFDKFLSLNRRKAVERGVRDLYSGFLETSSVEDADIRVALVILGFDALLGTIGESFVRVIEANPGRSLQEMSWGDSPPATGVPYSERVAMRTVEVAGVEIAQDERVRLFLNGFAAAGPECHGLYFGAGRHTCLGRPISQKLWQMLASGFSAVPRRLSIMSVGYRPSDHVFNCPTSIKVRIE
jgi:hypothetical protein